MYFFGEQDQEVQRQKDRETEEDSKEGREKQKVRQKRVGEEGENEMRDWEGMREVLKIRA